jgi:hypothetical protein
VILGDLLPGFEAIPDPLLRDGDILPKNSLLTF